MKYATIIPLIGGMSTGHKMATGNDPEFFLSYDAFAGNDSHAKMNFPNSPFHMIDEESNSLKEKVELPKVDFVSSVCPCAGLSALNAGNRGADAPQNDWMYKSTEFVLNNVQPKVFWGENAPALATKSGLPVAENLYEIGKKYGYSFSLVKTNTEFHGIPQRRNRSFYFFWKSPTSPILNYYNRDKKNLVEYLDEIPKDAPYQDIQTRDDYETNGLIQWFYSKPAYAEMNKGKDKTVMHFAFKNEKIEELIEYLEDRNLERELHFVKHAKFKKENGGNFWNSSPNLLYGHDTINAVQGRIYENSIHPNNERYLTIREHMHLMGLPHDYELSDIALAGNICQNVPTSTARDWTFEVMKFINGELPLDKVDFNIHDNYQSVNQPEMKTKSLF